MSKQDAKEDSGWIELAALLPSGAMVRDKFVRRDGTEDINQWKGGFGNTNIFSSIAIYAQPASGSKFIVPIFFDIDSADDLPGARQSTIVLCEMLMSRTKVTQDQLDIYFSGSKGFHVLISCETFQSFYSPHTLGLYKRMAEKAEQMGVKYVDKSVYSRRRIFRCSNSRHGRSGLFKVPLTFEELRDTGMEGILKIAEAPRSEDSFVAPRICDRAVFWYREAIEWFERNAKSFSASRINAEFKKGWRISPCVKAIQGAILPDGIRHQTYLTLARYFGYLNMHYEEILERLQEIDSRHPIWDPDSMERAADSGCRHPGFPGCDDPVLARYCQKDKCFYLGLKHSLVESSTKRTTGHKLGK